MTPDVTGSLFSTRVRRFGQSKASSLELAEYDRHACDAPPIGGRARVIRKMGGACPFTATRQAGMPPAISAFVAHSGAAR